MNEQELTRKLNSVGKSAFVVFFDLFKEFSNGRISRDACIDLLVNKKVSNSAGAAIRTGNAQQIFRAGMEQEALEIVANSDRLDVAITSMARKLLA